MVVRISQPLPLTVVVNGALAVPGMVKRVVSLAERLLVVLGRGMCLELLSLVIPGGGHLQSQPNQAVVQINQPPSGKQSERGALMTSRVGWPVAVRAWKPLAVPF